MYIYIKLNRNLILTDAFIQGISSTHHKPFYPDNAMNTYISYKSINHVLERNIQKLGITKIRN